MCIIYTNQLTGVLYLEIKLFLQKTFFFETWRLLNISDHLQSVFWSDFALITSWFRNLYTALLAMFNIAMPVAMVVCSPKVYLQNAFSRRFAWWRHLTKTTRILHVFCFYANKGTINHEPKTTGILVVAFKLRQCANLLFRTFSLHFDRNPWEICTYENYNHMII